MHIAATLLPLALSVAAKPISRRDAAIRDSPSGTYAPTVGQCPSSGAAIRQGSAIDPSEKAYVQDKAVTSLGDWTSYLQNIGLEGFNISEFVPSSENAVAGQTVPIVALGISGGGQRAMLTGGGIFAAFDGRNATTVALKSGGVLQLASYMGGVSGGAWMTGSWSLSGYPSFENLRDQVWNMTEGYLTPSPSHPSMDADAAASVTLKAATGAPVSVVDAYGRFLAYHLTNDSRPNTDVKSGPGAATLFSSIRQTPLFKSKAAPFPIILSTGRIIGKSSDTIENPIYESTPYHFGTNLPTSGGLFVPIDFLGTKFENGVPSNSSTCVTGFENAAFLMGCSGNIFGAPVQIGANAANMSAITGNKTIMAAIGAVPDEKLDNGRVINPFLGLAASTGYPASADPELALLDGGNGGENIPLFPFMQKSRAIDVMVVVDASADNLNYPTGSAIHNTYLKSLQTGYNDTPFPVIPAVADFVSQGLNTRPVFFGSTCVSQPKNVSTPLVVYLPNYFVNYPTNTSTFATSYTTEQTYGFFQNGLGIATQDGSDTWPTCLACSLVDAQQTRNGKARSSQCQGCFEEYCYVGSQ
ncbi:hypothetical protein RQP46_008768 [Phenoliferia psychrophenolica]